MSTHTIADAKTKASLNLCAAIVSARCADPFIVWRQLGRFLNGISGLRNNALSSLVV